VSAAPPLVARAGAFGARTAIAAGGATWTYGDLLAASARVAARLLDGRADLAEARVAFQVPPGFAWVAVLWGIWRAGGIAVPLGLAHPPAELEHVVGDATPEILVAAGEQEAALRPIAARERRRLVTCAEALAAQAEAALPAVAPSRRALIVYTSGTTGTPKGAVTTHAALQAQVTALVEAWGWTADDRILLVLPLHHVHGIVNVVLCALWSGATCDMLPRFDAAETWARIAEGRLTLFMAVPTVYRRLVAAWEAAPAEARRAMSDACRRLRLMVSGSAALPVATLERWRELSGHVLLERYGMTELGMALSNPLHGVRRPGYVGRPLPGVEVRLVDGEGRAVPEGTPGEIEVRGPGVFLEYWGRPEATRTAFRDGWFRTGDTAVVEGGDYRLLGRTSVDIIKSGGEKVSALEIEEVLRAHPAVAECAVVGVADPDWGEKVCVAAELRPGAALSLEELAAWARVRLAPCKVPKALRCVEALPRNAMGKVVKPEVAKLF